MARDTVDQAPEELERTDKRRGQNPARIVAGLIVLAVAVVFVVQNRQTVAVRWWFVTGHVRLVWLIVVCLALGAAIEALLRRMIRLRIRARRQQRSR